MVFAFWYVLGGEGGGIGGRLGGGRDAGNWRGLGELMDE